MRRRTQIGVLSFLLTLVWAAGLFVAFVGGKIGQHPSAPIALAASGAFCASASGLMLTLACFPGLAEILRPVAQVAAVGAALDAGAVMWSELPWNNRKSPPPIDKPIADVRTVVHLADEIRGKLNAAIEAAAPVATS